MSRSRVLGVTICALTVTFLISACSGSGSDGQGQDDSGSNSGTGQGTDGNTVATHSMTGEPVQVELVSVNRESSEALTVWFRITNNSSESWIPPSGAGESGTEPVGGTTVVDIENRKRYFPLYGTGGECSCSERQWLSLEPGKSKYLWAAFPAPPQNVRNISVFFPLTAPFLGVPVTSGPIPDSLPTQGRKRAPSKLDLKKPKVLAIKSLVDSLDGSKAVEENDKTRKVHLSSDVLFDLNKATLKPKARSELREVAKRIDKVGVKTVHIDGYTDSSGSPAINEPLSRKRAKSVADALRGLVSSSGVTFDAQGHGADDPVADNSTKAGRQKNRRVTISYAQ